MQLEIYYIIYLVIFRCAIIAAGIVSIVLGYRLFIHGITAANQGAALDTSIAGMSFKLQNAAPGTFFAIFGVIIISVMLGTSPPEYKKSTQASSGAERNVTGTPATTVSTLTLRADGNEVAGLIEKGNNYIVEGNLQDATFAYKQALDKADEKDSLSVLFNKLAWRYYSSGEALEKALHLSLVSNDLQPLNLDYIDTLVNILVKMKHFDRAVAVLDKASDKLPSLNSRLAEVRAMQNRGE